MADDLLKYNEYTPQIQGLDRQRKMAEMLMTQGLQPQQGQMISGRYVAPSWTQNLAGLANIAAGSYIQEQADKKQMELANALRGERAESMRKFAMAETPQERFNIAASDPNLHQFLPEMMKNISVKKGETIYSPITGKALYEGTADLPSDIEKAIIYKNLPPNPKDWTPEQRQLAEATNITHTRAGAPNMTAITNVQAFEPFANKVQTKMGEGLVENYQTLKNIPNEINNLNKAAQLAPQSFAGTFAQQKLEVAKLFNNNFGTNIAVDKIRNTEELGSRLFQSTMENLKKMDASPSQYQQKVMQDAFGTITTDPSSLPKIIAIQKEALTNKALQHNKQVRESQQGPAKLQYPYDISIPIEQGWSIKQ